MSEMTVTPYNADAMALVRLHLERLPMMTPDERAVFLDATRLVVYPVCIVKP